MVPRSEHDIATTRPTAGYRREQRPPRPDDERVRGKRSGLVYISNDNPTQIEVYFDEVSITHTPTNIIQYNECYPFGLQAGTSWTRENNKNDYLYNEGSELNAISGWYETFFRSYDPALGKFMQVDPLATVTHSMSAYHYGKNNPVLFNDPTGLLYRPRDNQAPHWDLSSLPIWTGSRDDWSDQSVSGGGAQFVWNPMGGEEISREEWLELAGEGGENVHADKYYPGAWEIQFGAESESEQQGNQGCPPGVNCDDIRNQDWFEDKYMHVQTTNDGTEYYKDRHSTSRSYLKVSKDGKVIDHVDPFVNSLKKAFNDYMTPERQEAYKDLGEDIIESLEWVEKYFDKYWGPGVPFFPPPGKPKFDPEIIKSPNLSPLMPR